MSHNAVQPIETSHYTYDAHKSPATTNKQDSTHHSASSTTAQLIASKIHPVVDKPIEHPHTTTTALVAAPTQHPHAAEKPHTAAVVERPHAIAGHVQPAVDHAVADHAQRAVAQVTSNDKETPKHTQVEAAKPHPQAAVTTAAATAKPHPHVAFEHPEHPIVIPVPSHSSSSRPAVEHIEDKQHHTTTTEAEPHHPHNHHSQFEQGEQAPHKHDYNEAAHPPHHSTSASTNTHANDVLVPSDSILSESPLADSGPAERRQSWNKDEMKRGVMESLLEKEGKKKGAKGGYSSTSPGH